MALFHCHFRSETLQIAASMDVILPQKRGFTGKFQTLYLLHGLSDDHSIWQRRTSIERYVDGLDLAVVMPAVNRSFYTDMAHGAQYWRFISDELPALARSFFPLSDRRQDNFVAGLSMGGYGAFKLALRRPRDYAAAASLSGVLDIAGRVQQATGERQAEYEQVFGDVSQVVGSDEDLMHVAEKLVKSKVPPPQLFQCCGTEDGLYEGNLRFGDHAKKLGLEVAYSEAPGGHDWGFWDEHIQRVLAWLPLQERS